MYFWEEAQQTFPDDLQSSAYALWTRVQHHFVYQEV